MVSHRDGVILESGYREVTLTEESSSTCGGSGPSQPGWSRPPAHVLSLVHHSVVDRMVGPGTGTVTATCMGYAVEMGTLIGLRSGAAVPAIFNHARTQGDEKWTCRRGGGLS